MDNHYPSCTKCGENKRGMFCDECTLPHCDDCGECEITTPRIWQDVLEDLEGFPVGLVTRTVEALSKVRDEELERLRLLVGVNHGLHRSAHEDAVRAEDAFARVDAKHQRWHAWTFIPCAYHEGGEWRREITKCSKCVRGVISSCVNERCGPWPCETHLALHDETEEECQHHG